MQQSFHKLKIEKNQIDDELLEQAEGVQKQTKLLWNEMEAIENLPSVYMLN